MRRLAALTRSPTARVFALTSALTLISAWSLLRHLSSALPSDLGDPILETWILWWNAHAVPFKETEELFFLFTVYPSRAYQKRYGGKET